MGIPGRKGKMGRGEKAESSVRKQANFSRGGTAVAVEKLFERQTLDKSYRGWQH